MYIFIKRALDECGICNTQSRTQVDVLWLQYAIKRIF